MARWCGCESASKHYTIGGLHSDLPRRCRLAEGLDTEDKILEDEESVTESDSDWVEPLNIDPPAPETFEDEESETESNSDKVEPSTPPEDNNNDKTKTSRLDSKENTDISKQDAVAKSDASRKRKREESSLNITCKKHKKSNTISVCIKVSDLVVNISVGEE